MLAAIRFDPIFDSPLLVGGIVVVLGALVLLRPAFGRLTLRQRWLLLSPVDPPRRLLR